MRLENLNNSELAASKKSLIYEIKKAVLENNIPLYILHKDKLNQISRILMKSKN